VLKKMIFKGMFVQWLLLAGDSCYSDDLNSRPAWVLSVDS
jgi:hypothetical protein